tara:strand:- start:965 stop:1165 length:201 start_codon:yes stop_codon:yes gene_type:complete
MNFLNLNIINYSENVTQKNIPKNNKLFLGITVTATGVEPTTAGAEIQCSIQLSYAAIIYFITSNVF